MSNSRPSHEVLELERQIAAFVATKSDSERTRQAYHCRIRRAFQAMGITSPGEATAATLAAFNKALSKASLGAPSRAQTITAVRGFLQWSAERGELNLPAHTIHNLLRTPWVPKPRPYLNLTPKRVDRILAAAADSPRDQALIWAMVEGRLQLSEASVLNCSDLAETKRGLTLHVPNGHGNTERTLVLGIAATAALHRYLQATGRAPGDEEPLFLAQDAGVHHGNRTQRLSQWGIRMVLHQHGKRIGLKIKRKHPQGGERTRTRNRATD